MSKARVYLETSVVSYLTARPSRDLIVAAHQQITLDWWENRRHGFEVLISELVVAEARLCDPTAAEKRVAALSGLPQLRVPDEARQLALMILRDGLLPQTAFADALHIATAAVHRLDYLITWNCSHIANAEILPRVAHICMRNGFDFPYICTPEELMGENT